MPRPKRSPRPPDPIDIINAKSDAEFLADYLEPTPTHPSSPWTSLFTHPHTHTSYTLTLTSSPDLPSCLSLIALTSRQHYGPLWSPPSKLKEMRTPGLRYILIHHAHTHALVGFTSLLPTYEPPHRHPVLYIYEIHLLPELRSCGLGARLMRMHLAAAERIEGVERVMLTCFVANEGAMGFYTGGMGFEVDETSPLPGAEGGRKLRGGKVVATMGGGGKGYVILSRRVKRGEEGGGGEKTGNKPAGEEGTGEDRAGAEGTGDMETGEDGTDQKDEGRSPLRKRRRVVGGGGG